LNKQTANLKQEEQMISEVELLINQRLVDPTNAELKRRRECLDSLADTANSILESLDTVEQRGVQDIDSPYESQHVLDHQPHWNSAETDAVKELSSQCESLDQEIQWFSASEVSLPVKQISMFLQSAEHVDVVQKTMKDILNKFKGIVLLPQEISEVYGQLRQKCDTLRDRIDTRLEQIAYIEESKVASAPDDIVENGYSQYSPRYQPHPQATIAEGQYLREENRSENGDFGQPNAPELATLVHAMPTVTEHDPNAQYLQLQHPSMHSIDLDHDRNNAATRGYLDERKNTTCSVDVDSARNTDALGDQYMRKGTVCSVDLDAVRSDKGDSTALPKGMSSINLNGSHSEETTMHPLINNMESENSHGLGNTVRTGRVVSVASSVSSVEL